MLGNYGVLDYHCLSSFCSAVRNTCSSNGTYDRLSKTKDGIYIRNYTLLDKIKFVWKDRIVL